MSTIVVPTVNSIAMDHRRRVRFMAAFFIALGYHVRKGIRTVSDLMERRFAEFAGVPGQNLSRRQWEELWETEADLAMCSNIVVSTANARRLKEWPRPTIVEMPSDCHQ